MRAVRPETTGPKRPWPVTAADLPAVDATGDLPLALFCYADVRPLRGAAGMVDWRLCGAVSATLIDGTFSAEAGEVLLLPTTGRWGQRRVFVFGLGPRATSDAASLQRRCAEAAVVLANAGIKTVVAVAPSSGDVDDERDLGDAVEAGFGERVVVVGFLGHPAP